MDPEQPSAVAPPLATQQPSRRGWAAPLHELWSFLCRPAEPVPGFSSRLRAITFYAHLLVLVLAIEIAFLLLVSGFMDDAGAKFRGFGLGGWALAFGVLVFVPVLEELWFRSWLTRSAFLWPMLVWAAVRWAMPFLPLATAIQVAGLATTVLAVIASKRLPALLQRGDAVLRRWLPATVPISTVIFALIHVSNWDVAARSSWVLPLLVVPQFLSGLLLAYARVRSGLGAAIALHAAINVVGLAGYLAGQLAEP